MKNAPGLCLCITAFVVNFTIHLSAAICRHGKYGKGCELNCPSNCAIYRKTKQKLGFGPCDKITGRCAEGCVQGFHGTICDKTCVNGCLKCVQQNGRCMECSFDFKLIGRRCVHRKELCPSGKDCKMVCPTNCLLNQCVEESRRCTQGCKAGYHGLKCDVQCSEACIQATCRQDTGSCIFGCIDGYHQTDNGCEIVEGLHYSLYNIGIAVGCMCSLVGTFWIFYEKIRKKLTTVAQALYEAGVGREPPSNTDANGPKDEKENLVDGEAGQSH